MKVLVVDDTLDIANTLAFLLRNWGHEAEFAVNGHAALTIAQRQRPDVIFLDLGLPDFEGFTLARRLRTTPELAASRIIAITGRTSDDDESRAIEAGCERLLRKPIDPAFVQDLVSGKVSQPEKLLRFPRKR
ncbi:MAG TPA: response regulator [Burkholderiales bacterium]|nr:response regulator [Burkholderiales bacterium]